MEINPSFTGLTNVLALVNAANGTSFTSDVVKLTNIRPFQDLNFDANTVATLVGVNPQYHKNSADIHYRRLHVGQTLASPPPEYEINENTTIEDVTAMVSSVLRLIPTEVIFKNFRTDEMLPISYITLEARPNSPTYIGSLEIPLVWTGGEEGLISLLEPGRLLHQLINYTMPAEGYF